MNSDLIRNEISFKALRSSGAGGQHVNKVSTKIELQFDIQNSEGLNEDEKTRLLSHLSNRINKNGVLILHCDEARSQYRNKEIVTERFFKLVTDSLVQKKKRKPTKVSKKATEKRLEDKRRLSQKKTDRRDPEI